MKKIITLSVLFMALAITFSSCSKEKKLANRLEGTWNIDKLEGSITPAGGGVSTPLTFSNVGTMTFKSDKTGTSSIDFTGTPLVTSFVWANTATTVTITESGETPTVMTVSTNEKTKQVWTYTETDATSSTTVTYTLTKK